jgi:hypothetical protein
MIPRVKARLRVAGGQVASAWYLLPWITQRNGVIAAHLRLVGADFSPPIELGSEIVLDLVLDGLDLVRAVDDGGRVVNGAAPDALAVNCPRCYAYATVRCIEPDGSWTEGFHAEREEAARLLAIGREQAIRLARESEEES